MSENCDTENTCLTAFGCFDSFWNHVVSKGIYVDERDSCLNQLINNVHHCPRAVPHLEVRKDGPVERSDSSDGFPDPTLQQIIEVDLEAKLSSLRSKNP